MRESVGNWLSIGKMSISNVCSNVTCWRLGFSGIRLSLDCLIYDWDMEDCDGTNPTSIHVGRTCYRHSLVFILLVYIPSFFLPDVSSFILIVMNVLSSFIHEIFPSDFLDRADILCGWPRISTAKLRWRDVVSGHSSVGWIVAPIESTEPDKKVVTGRRAE